MKTRASGWTFVWVGRADVPQLMGEMINNWRRGSLNAVFPA